MSDLSPEAPKLGSLIPFEFEGRSVRSMMRDDQPWFVLADVCKVLDLTNPSEAAKGLDDDERMTLSLTDGHSGQRGGARSLVIITEAGVNRLIFRSDKPQAKRLQKWFFADVLPALRRTGTYTVPGASPPAEPATVSEVGRTFRALRGIARTAGITGNHAVIAAAQGTARILGVNPLELVGATHLPASVQEELLTATQLGERVGGASAREINLRLLRAELHVGGPGDWRPTPKGEAFGMWSDTGKRHNNGTPIRQWRWYARVVDQLGPKDRGGEHADD